MLTAVGIMIAFILFGLYSKLTITEYIIASENLPEVFDGFRIVLISDLHGYTFGRNQSELIKAVEEQKPDIIVMCGDMIDKKDKTLTSRSFNGLFNLLDGITEIAPVYAVSGNHEILLPDDVYMGLLDVYESYGITYMHGKTVSITKDDQSITIYSVPPKSDKAGAHWVNMNYFRKSPAGEYSILICHYGNKFDLLSKGGHDLVLAGHTHGGIIRLFGRGLIDNDGEFFPKYDKGIFTENGSIMVLSAGLGDAFILPRLFNRRELVTVVLRSAVE